MTAPRPRVLVVDDDFGVRTTVSEILRRAGYEVLEVGDGQAAVDVLRRERVGLVLLDIRMPVLDGIGVLDALDEPPTVLLVSAFSVDPETRARVGAKVYRYLRKPVAPRHLLEVVAEAAAFRDSS
jgi:CheY-like chemotaxis protein